MNNNNWQVEIIETLDQIESIRSVWQQLQDQEPCPVINADIDRYLSVLKANENRCSPLFILLKKGQFLRAIIIGRREKLSIPVCIGYKTFLRPKLNAITVVYGVILGQPDNETSALLCKEFRKLLRKRQIDVIFFNHLRIDTQFFIQIRRGSFWSRSHFLVIEPHWRMSIPSNVDEFYTKLSKKHRANLKRDQKKLESQYKERLHIIHYRKNCNLEKMFHDAVVVSEKTYQHPLGVGFYDNPLLRSIIAKDIEKGRLFLSIMYLRNQPVSFQWGTIYRGTYFLEKLGYDPHYASWNVGSVLFLKVLDELCSDPKALQLDFGFGDAEYKQSYGDESWQEAAATYLFAPRVYPILINLVITVNSIFTLGLMWTVKKCGIYGWLKRKWRRKLHEKIENQR
jgi:hypothetical protein